MSRNNLPLYVMPLIILVAALLQSTVTARMVIRGVKPDIVLLIIVLSTLIYGSKVSVLWAFLGGIGVDLFSGGPFGISSLGLMMATAVVGLGHRVLSRYHLLVPLGATAVGTLIYGFVYMGVLAVLHEAAQTPLFQTIALPAYQLPFWATLQNVILPAAIYNTTIVLFVTPLLNRVPEVQEV